MTLNSVMAVILCYFTELRSFGADYVIMLKYRPILSVTKM